MSPRQPPAAPRRADLRRMRAARREARSLVAAADARFAGERLSAFRGELAATVRQVTPFLVALLERSGATLDDVVARIEPGLNWPFTARGPRAVAGFAAGAHDLRHAAAGAMHGGVPFKGWRRAGSGVDLELADGAWAYVHVVAHSVEIEVRIGAAHFSTRFGELRIQIPVALPANLAASAVGRAVGDLISHPAIAGAEWPVIEIERSGHGSVIVVEIGSVPWRWRRPS